MVTFIKKLAIGCAVALAFYATVELVLMAVGVIPLHERTDPYVGFSGYAPLFLKRTSPSGQPIFETAPNKLAWFNLQSFPAHKAKGVTRVFCLGGSTAYGHPYDDQTSFAGWLRVFLPAVDPQRRWEVINAGGISYASYREARLIEELSAYEPDLFIVYGSHNEFLEQRTYDKLLKTPRLVRDVGALASRLRLYSVLHDLAQRRQSAVPSQEGGAVLGAEVKAVLDRSVGPDYYHRDDEMHRAVMDHFRDSLIRMTEISARTGAKIIFITPASNIGDFSPFKTEPSPGLSAAAIDEVKKLKAAAATALDAGDYAHAEATAAQALAVDRRDAEALYFRGQALRGLGRIDEARAALIAARDEDVCPLRALTPICQIVTDVARQTGAGLVDFVQMMNERAKDGIPGSDWFLDHVHPTIEGNRVLALALIKEMERRNLVAPAPAWNDAAIATVTQKLNGSVDEKAHALALKRVAKVLVWAGKYREAEHFIDLALRTIPENAEAHLSKGTIRETAGDKEGALLHFREAVRLAPAYAHARRCLGMTLFELGHAAEARVELEEAVRLDPKLVEAHYGLGAVLQTLGDKKGAAAAFRTVLQLDPMHAEAHNDLAGVLFEMGNLDEAAVHYQRALEIRAIAHHPGLADVHVNLANLCLRKGNVDDAISHFQKALEIKPNSVEAHYGLADVLLQKGSIDEAIAQYEKALALKPDSAEAHGNVGSAFLQKGDLAQAIAHYQKALAIKTDFLEIQNNLAWVLATCPEASWRNGTKAVELAERANRLTGGKNPMILHTLAAAYAEAGRFDDARRDAKNAIALAQSAEQPELVNQLNVELRLYEAKRPFHNDVQ